VARAVCQNAGPFIAPSRICRCIIDAAAIHMSMFMSGESPDWSRLSGPRPPFVTSSAKTSRCCSVGSTGGRTFTCPPPSFPTAISALFMAPPAPSGELGRTARCRLFWNQTWTWRGVTLRLSDSFFRVSTDGNLSVLNTSSSMFRAAAGIFHRLDLPFRFRVGGFRSLGTASSSLTPESPSMKALRASDWQLGSRCSSIVGPGGGAP
jgi:hypothetical protein